MSWSKILHSRLLSYYEKEKGVFMWVEFALPLMVSHMHKYVEIKINRERDRENIKDME